MQSLLRCKGVLPRIPVLIRSLGHFSTVSNDCLVRSPAPDIELPKEDLFTTVTAGFSKYGSRVGITDGLTGREYSYNEIEERICRFSSSLQERGYERGDVTCIVSPNNPEYAVAFLGILRCGGVVSTCNPAFTAQELAFQFKNSGAKMVITVPECLSSVREAANIAGVDKIIVIDTEDPQSSSNNLISYQSIIRESVSIRDAVLSELDDVAVLPYSSGTTGIPKGVMLTNSSIASNIFQIIHPEFLEFDQNISASIMGILPFFHIYGMVVVLLSSLFNGSNIISLPKFEPETFLNAIERYRIDTGFFVPPLVLFLAKHPLVDKYDLTSLNDIITGAAPLGGEVVKAAVDRTKCDVIRQAYGLTETSPVTHIMPRSLGTKYPSSIGSCIRSLTVKVVDPETNMPLPANKEGELWISGPNVMKGYLNNPEATQNSVVDGSWFKTGDVGYYDEQGLFYITDRLKELIKVKGFQVAPAELEAILLTHPNIADAAVIGVPDERLGEAPMAFVVKKESSLMEDEVKRFIAMKVAKHKHLAGGVQFISEVPKSPSGKILRRLLRK